MVECLDSIFTPHTYLFVRLRFSRKRSNRSSYGLFDPKTIRSRGRKFQVWNFRSLERFFSYLYGSEKLKWHLVKMELNELRLGTFAPGGEWSWERKVHFPPQPIGLKFCTVIRHNLPVSFHIFGGDIPRGFQMVGQKCRKFGLWSTHLTAVICKTVHWSITCQLQGDHSGKPGNVRDFTKSQGNAREKSCREKLPKTV